MNMDPLEKIFQSGKTPVGYLCTATPPEIIHAAGGHPFRITGKAEGQETAEKLAHPNLCGLCKSAINWASALPKEKPFVFVATSSCDGCKRLGFILDTLPAVIDVIRLDLPRMARETDISYFITQLRTFHHKLAKILGTDSSPESLAGSISAYRKTRTLLRQILHEVHAGKLPLKNSFEATNAFFHLAPDSFTDYAQTLLASASTDSPAKQRPKVILAGNVTYDSALADQIELAGVQVVGLDLCNVERAAFIDVKDNVDPYRALAEAVYARPQCPRFEPGDLWAKRLALRTKETGAEAVILFSLKFCDNTLYAFPPLRDALEQYGLKVLTLEGEYSPDLPGQLATRIEAFCEML